MGASYEVRGNVAVITLDNPPVNGLGYDTRREFSAGVERALADAAVDAIVVTGAGKAFSGGADIKEFGSPKAVAEPNLLSLIRQLEHASKPVVAAVHSVCMGGGLELALGCHYRVAAPGTNVALPEVKIGLIPGAGGTQRLPRVLGVETALNMIVSGEPVKSETARGDARPEAVRPHHRRRPARRRLRASPARWRWRTPAAAAAAGARPEGHAPERRRLLPVRAQHGQGHGEELPGAGQVRGCGGSAVKRQFDDGMAYERELFTALMFTPECKALRHAFFGERAASKIPDVPEDTPQRADRQGGRHRRRHHGRRHQHELPQRRHPGGDAGDEAGGAGPRRGDDPQELRQPGEEGQAQAGQARRSAWRC